jgi:hypothetical protein
MQALARTRGEDLGRFRTPASLVRAIGPLTELTGSSSSALLVLQLEYWFSKKNEGFYKFLAPCQHTQYREGDSWTEQLGLSKDQLRTALAKLCTQYTSRTAFRKACAEGLDPFQGRMYLSYIDKRSNLTHYLRNHRLAWEELTRCGLDVMPPRDSDNTPPEMGKAGVPVSSIEPQAQSLTTPNNNRGGDTESEKPRPTAAEVRHHFEHNRHWPEHQARSEATRFVSHYTSTSWTSASGYPIDDWRETANRWRPTRQRPPTPKRVGESSHNTETVRAIGTPQVAAIPDNWDPQYYVRVPYLQQIAYMTHLKTLGWESVRPPEGTPAVVDRWFVQCENTSTALSKTNSNSSV